MNLLSSIVGLLGVIGLFRVLFILSDITLSNVSKRKQSTAPFASKSVQLDDSHIDQTGNPLRRGANKIFSPLDVLAPVQNQPEAASSWKRYEDSEGIWFSKNGESSKWKHVVDGKDAWYFNEETKESVWRLPT